MKGKVNTKIVIALAVAMLAVTAAPVASADPVQDVVDEVEETHQGVKDFLAGGCMENPLPTRPDYIC